MFYRPSFLAGLLLVLAPFNQAIAGADTSEAVEYLNLRILTSPADAALYARRAGLFADKKNWPEAFADLQRLSDLGEEQRATYLRGEFHARQGQWHSAIREFDRVIKRDSRNIPALLQRAKAHDAVGRAKPALADYQRVLRLFPNAEYGAYRRTAELLLELKGIDPALDFLDARMKTVGVIPQLQNLAITMTKQAKRYPEAMARLESLSVHYKSSPYWNVDMAEVLLLNKNSEQAKYHLQIAEHLLEARQQTKASQRLAAQIGQLKQQYQI
ncbi:tetratricopeptide repeat protein [Spongiibacter sp. KMU-158]|uniref:Tetratricopeptide repeat protein n=1 Tax=Spongiibacter pelagi TaxID=2760804 RepID=A0A927C175_9GAMM|nr:tetratricopeptide repeat protein [Spongiibacter pelagi]MBD2857771.1 tetratricopeptide repeat protein [Spongiibacter pelagi]